MRARYSVAELQACDPGMDVDTMLVPVPGPARPLSEGLGVQPGGMQFMRVSTERHSFALGLNTQVVKGQLLVSFHGVRADEETDCSAFRLLSWSGALGTAVLALSEPDCETVWPSHAPRSTNYLLDLKGDPDAEINALIDQTAAELGLSPDRVVLCGNSIGAAAAMRIAARRPVGRVVLSGALTDLDGLRRYVDAWLRRMGLGWDDFDAIRRQQPWRIESVTAWQHGLAAGHDLRMVVLQSDEDRLTRGRHHPYLCAALGLDPERGGPSADGRVLLVLQRSDKHGAEPTLALHQLARQVFDTPPSQVAGLSLPGLSPGSWHFDRAVTEQLQVHHRGRVALRPPESSDASAAGADAPRTPLLPPTSSGVLLLVGSPTVALKPVVRAMMLLPNTRRLEDELLVDAVRNGGPLEASHLCDANGVAMVEDGEWSLGVVRQLFQNSPAVLSFVPAVRVLYLMRDPLEAIAERLREADGPVDVQLDRAVDEWNRAAHAVLAACHGADGARIRVLAEDSLVDPTAWAALLSWLGRNAGSEIAQPAQRLLQRQGQRANQPWTVRLDAAQRRRLLLTVDWGAYRRLVSLCG